MLDSRLPAGREKISAARTKSHGSAHGAKRNAHFHPVWVEMAGFAAPAAHSTFDGP